jgi:hypothetical protein
MLARMPDLRRAAHACCALLRFVHLSVRRWQHNTLTAAHLEGDKHLALRFQGLDCALLLAVVVLAIQLHQARACHEGIYR